MRQTNHNNSKALIILLLSVYRAVLTKNNEMAIQKPIFDFITENQSKALISATLGNTNLKVVLQNIVQCVFVLFVAEIQYGSINILKVPCTHNNPGTLA